MGLRAYSHKQIRETFSIHSKELSYPRTIDNTVHGIMSQIKYVTQDTNGGVGQVAANINTLHKISEYTVYKKKKKEPAN